MGQMSEAYISLLNVKWKWFWNMDCYLPVSSLRTEPFHNTIKLWLRRVTYPCAWRKHVFTHVVKYKKLGLSTYLSTQRWIHPQPDHPSLFLNGVSAHLLQALSRWLHVKILLIRARLRPVRGWRRSHRARRKDNVIQNPSVPLLFYLSGRGGCSASLLCSAVRKGTVSYPPLVIALACSVLFSGRDWRLGAYSLCLSRCDSVTRQAVDASVGYIKQQAQHQ